MGDGDGDEDGMGYDGVGYDGVGYDGMEHRLNYQCP